MNNKALQGITVAFSGTPDYMTRETAVEAVKAMGGQVYGSVSSKVELLIAFMDHGSKVDMAEKSGILSINEVMFQSLVDGLSRLVRVDGKLQLRNSMTSAEWQQKMQRDCPNCGHPWVEHILNQPCPTNSEIAGRVMRPSTKLRLMDCPAANPERIVAAAIQVEGTTISLPLPARHGQVIHAALNMHLPDHMVTTACQGFLTSTGRFVNRVQAKQIAHMAGQPQLRPEGERTKDLYSEDLW